MGVYPLVFPTHVGVFPTGHPAYSPRARLPHTRGGVSTRNAASLCIMSSSPHTWGCFSLLVRQNKGGRVFPTHVGVFLWLSAKPLPMPCLPHTRGGVSNHAISYRAVSGSSPHTWGCFTVKPAEPRPDPVFPTHVGVFPPFRLRALPPESLPHTRGGVSARSSSFPLRTTSSPHTWGCFLKPYSPPAPSLPCSRPYPARTAG